VGVEHNIVVGYAHDWTSYSGLVAGGGNSSHGPTDGHRPADSSLQSQPPAAGTSEPTDRHHRRYDNRRNAPTDSIRHLRECYSCSASARIAERSCVWCICVGKQDEVDVRKRGGARRGGSALESAGSSRLRPSKREGTAVTPIPSSNSRSTS
jgi:hypothetical protein